MGFSMMFYDFSMGFSMVNHPFAGSSYGFPVVWGPPFKRLKPTNRSMAPPMMETTLRPRGRHVAHVALVSHRDADGLSC